MEYTCDECSAAFSEDTHYWRRFCSRKCRNRYWNRKRYDAFKEKRDQEKAANDARLRALVEERRG